MSTKASVDGDLIVVGIDPLGVEVFQLYMLGGGEGGRSRSSMAHMRVKVDVEGLDQTLDES